MRLAKFVLSASVALGGVTLSSSAARAGGPTDVPPDPKVVEFINSFCTQMNEAMKDKPSPSDAEIAALGKQAMKFYHRSHYNNAGDNLKDDRLRFSFKKGATDLKFYDCPVNITRVRKTGTTGIGFRDTAEKGSVYDYFLKKKEGVAGMPAQVRIFISEKGQISFDDLGSL